MASSELVAVVGLGVNNRPLVPFLLSEGYRVKVFDRKDVKELTDELAQLGVASEVDVHGGPDYLQALVGSGAQTVYVTPGMKKYGPQFDAMQSQGMRLTSETDLFLSRCPAPVIGITGSAGKTTTTTLVGEALRRDGRHPVFVGGNIGQSLLPRLSQITPDSWVVMELSSFQLQLVEHSPHGAALLNISPNHLDIHRDYRDYQYAKGNIVRYQSKEDWAVLPYHDEMVRQSVLGAQSRQVYFSLDGPIPHGAYWQDGRLWWRGGNGARAVVDESALKLVGRHNVSNALAAIAIVASAGGDLGALSEVLESFSGVPHRLERVREVAGITYINDSIATAPDRTIAALKAFTTPMVLILGGYDKKLDYTPLGQALKISSVHTVVAMGEVREKIMQVVRQWTDIPIIEAHDFDEAVMLAKNAAQPGDLVLLSPAAASYDMFSNFEARGQRFREMVGILNHSESGLAE